MILVADKSEHSRYRLARILEREGHRVLVASDINEAKATAAVLNIDLLLADIDLPGVAGGDLLQSLRGQPGGRRPAALALAAKASPRMAEATGIGFDGCLLKPINEADLKEAARKALAAPAAGDATDPTAGPRKCV